MEQELVITKAKYINDRAYIPLTVMAANQQQKYIDLLTSKDAEVANKEMAEKLGIKQQQYARYEKGINVMPITYLKPICEILNVSADYILGLDQK